MVRWLVVVLSTCIAACWLSNSAMAQPALTLDPDFPNPLALEGLESDSARPIADLGSSECQGFVGTRPIATITFSTPMKNVEITVPGATTLVVLLPNKVGYCDSTTTGTPSVTLPKWPAERVAIFAGGMTRDAPVRLTLVTEAKSRPIQVRLGDETTPRIRIDSAPKTPIVRQIPLRASAFRQNDCGWFEEKATLLLDITKPTTGLRLGGRPEALTKLLVRGPVPIDGRNIKTACLDRAAPLPMLEPGLYAVHVGSEERPALERVLLVALTLVGKDTVVDTTTMVAHVPKGLPLPDRDVLQFFPFADAQRLIDSDWRRFSILKQAPAALLVYPKHDLDSAGASLVVTGQVLWPQEDKMPAHEFPKKNEPVLLVGKGMILTTDGLLFRVALEDLTDEPDGVATLPRAPRDPHASYDMAVKMAGPDDAPVLRRAGSGQDAKVWTQLIKSRTSRRESALVEVRKRLQPLLPPS